jgi:hypothetical protein
MLHIQIYLLTHVFNHLSKVRNQKRFKQTVVCLHFHIFQFEFNVALFISIIHFKTRTLNSTSAFRDDVITKLFWVHYYCGSISIYWLRARNTIKPVAHSIIDDRTLMPCVMALNSLSYVYMVKENKIIDHTENVLSYGGSDCTGRRRRVFLFLS